MKKLTRLTFLMLLLLTLKTNVSLGKNTSQIIMPINDDLPYRCLQYGQLYRFPKIFLIKILDIPHINLIIFCPTRIINSLYMLLTPL